MIRRIRRFYPVLVKNTRDRGQFAGFGPSTIAETCHGTG
jgi:hypothetical protein